MSQVVQAIIIVGTLPCLAAGVAHEWRAAMAGWHTLHGEAPPSREVSIRILAFTAANAAGDDRGLPTGPAPDHAGWQIAA